MRNLSISVFAAFLVACLCLLPGCIEDAEPTFAVSSDGPDATPTPDAEPEPDAGTEPDAEPDPDASPDPDAEPEPVVDNDGDGYTSLIDCDDDNKDIHPQADEVCDGIDNDCDGKTDEGLEVLTIYRDADGDGFGNADDSKVSCLLAGWVTDDTDCNDERDDIAPGLDIDGDGIDNDCDEDPQDGKDGKDANPWICIPVNANSDQCEHGGFFWLCGYDANGDGNPDVGGTTDSPPICNGAPGADGANGQPGQPGSDGNDGADAVQHVAYCEEATLEQCEYGGNVCTSGPDANGDGQPDEVVATWLSCNGAPGADGANGQPGADGNNGANGNDGANAPAQCQSDNDCELPSGTCFETGGNAYTIIPASTQCVNSYCTVVSAQFQCEDTCELVVNVPTCVTPVVDADGDGSPEGVDCDDSDADNFPGNPEVCDGADNDCDGETDEGVQSTFFPDTDGDGEGDENGQSVQACAAPANHVGNNTDCDDTAAAVNTQAAEVCGDGIDNDCSGGDLVCPVASTVTVTYPGNLPALILNVHVVTSAVDLGTGWDASQEVFGASEATVTLSTLSYDLPNVCALRLNTVEYKDNADVVNGVIVGSDDDWYCTGFMASAQLDQAVGVAISHQGQAYTQADLTTWSPNGAGGGCSALLILKTDGACANLVP